LTRETAEGKYFTAKGKYFTAKGKIFYMDSKEKIFNHGQQREKSFTTDERDSKRGKSFTR
jgi:hypothetical protein